MSGSRRAVRRQCAAPKAAACKGHHFRPAGPRPRMRSGASAPHRRQPPAIGTTSGPQGRDRERGPAPVRRTFKQCVSRPVSRVLSGGHPPRRSFVWSTACAGPRATNPDGGPGCGLLHSGCPGRRCHPYLVLLPVGFAVPATLPPPRCALTAPFHPYRGRPEPAVAVCSLWHCPWGRPRRPLAATVLPWSPDFPPPVPHEAVRQRPSSRLTTVE